MAQSNGKGPFSEFTAIRETTTGVLVSTKLCLCCAVVLLSATASGADDYARCEMTRTSTFDSRVLFHGNRYVGTWQHGEVGGHMWGMIEKKAEEKADAEK